MRRILTGGLAALLCILCTLPALADEVVKISRAQGEVKLRPSGDRNTKWEDAEAEQELLPGWELRTGAKSKALLVFPKGNTVALNEKSFVRILELDSDGGALIESDQPGGLLVQIKHKLSGGKEFTLRTPSAHAIVRGTEYGAQIIRSGFDDDGRPEYETEFYGYEGEVEIENEFGTRLLRADQTIRAVLGMIPGAPVDGLPDEALEFLRILEDPEAYVEDKAKEIGKDIIDEAIGDKIPGGIGRFFK